MGAKHLIASMLKILAANANLKRVLISVYALVFLFCGVSIGWGEPPAADPNSIQFGVWHPSPRLCQDQSHTQRDLNILRTIYFIALTDRQWRDKPWFYHSDHTEKTLGVNWDAFPAAPTTKSSPNNKLHQPLIANSEGLKPLSRNNIRGLNQADIIASSYSIWRKRLSCQLFQHICAPWQSTPALNTLLAQNLPFLFSKLNTIPLLPFHAQGSQLKLLQFKHVPDANLQNKLLAETQLETGQRNLSFKRLHACRSWPKKVRFLPTHSAKEIYRVALPATISRNRTRPFPIVLVGYHSHNTLWKAYQAQQLDGVLLEGEDWVQFKDTIAPMLETSNTQAAKRAGGQQIILRPLKNNKLKTALNAQHKRALSGASNRDVLANLQGVGHFGVTQRFFAPLLQPQPYMEDLWTSQALEHNAREARRLWFEQAQSPTRIIIYTLKHPWLYKLAQRLAIQWRRTLDLSVILEIHPQDALPLSVTNLPRTHAWLLEVVDTEDGSLFELWTESLRTAGTLPKAGVFHLPNVGLNTRQWVHPTTDLLEQSEIKLQNFMPYIPLIHAQHYVMCRQQSTQRLNACLQFFRPLSTAIPR